MSIYRTGSDKPGYAAAVAAAAPAVVNIHSTKITRSRICDIPRYRQLCERFAGDPQVVNSLGSGVVVREDGYILTNHHVVEDADNILVLFANNQTSGARVVGTDPQTDLAIIKVPQTGLPVIPYNEDDPARVGDIALAIGNPFGFSHSVSQGIVSAVSRSQITQNRFYDDFIQTDAAISPGNSGGALVDHRGRLIGINTMTYSPSGGSDGIGFAIPADLALRVMDQILEHGRVIRGWLGVALDPQSNGLRVTGVTRDSPAERAGLQINDVLLAANEVRATNLQRITNVIANTPPGETLQLEVMRDDRRFRAEATVAELRTR
jgi:S1-C subfamily serine protease